jgi:hypothetical protein
MRGQTSRRIWTNTVDKIRNRFKNAVLADKVTEGVLAAALCTRNAIAARVHRRYVFPEGTNHGP